MTELALKLAANGLILVIAVIGWGLENRWHDRRTKVHRRWARTLIVLLIAVSTVDGAMTWRTHGEEQEERERSARIEDGVKMLVKLARERDPNLTEQEALREVSTEIQTLRGRTSELERELKGWKRYASVAELNACGVRTVARLGLTRTTALSRTLGQAHTCKRDGEQPRVVVGCDRKGIAAFRNAAEIEPDFPFSYWGLAMCTERAGDEEWRTYAEKAVTILEHTTEITGHHEHHDEALQQLRELLSEQ